MPHCLKNGPSAVEHAEARSRVRMFASNEKGVPCSARLQITLCRTAGPSEVLPLAVAIAPFNGVTVVGACTDA